MITKQLCAALLLILCVFSTGLQADHQSEFIIYYGVSPENQGLVASIVIVDTTTREEQIIDISDTSVSIGDLGVAPMSNRILTTLSFSSGVDEQFHIVEVGQDGTMNMIIEGNLPPNNIAFVHNNPVDGAQFIYTQAVEDGLMADLYLYDRTNMRSQRLNDDLVKLIPGNLDWSADGEHIIFVGQSTMDGQIDIYMVDLNAGTLSRLTNTAEAEFEPKFAPSSTQILYTVQRGANLRIDLMHLDDRSTREVMAQEGIDVGNAQWLLDETGFVYESTKRPTDDDDFRSQLHIYNLIDDEQRTLATHPIIFEYVISPDGQHIAYINNTFDNVNPAAMCVIAISGQDDTWCTSAIPLQATPIIW